MGVAGECRDFLFKYPFVFSLLKDFWYEIRGKDLFWRDTFSLSRGVLGPVGDTIDAQSFTGFSIWGGPGWSWNGDCLSISGNHRRNGSGRPDYQVFHFFFRRQRIALD